MSVPGYQEFMFPILKCLYDGKQYHKKKICERNTVSSCVHYILNFSVCQCAVKILYISLQFHIKLA
jgi:hypothetical protein